MKLSKDELKVIEALDQNSPTLTFEQIREATGIPNNTLREILSKFIKLGLISETKAKEVIHIENGNKLAIIHIFGKR